MILLKFYYRSKFKIWDAQFSKYATVIVFFVLLFTVLAPLGIVGLIAATRLHPADFEGNRGVGRGG